MCIRDRTMAGMQNGAGQMAAVPDGSGTVPQRTEPNAAPVSAADQMCIRDRAGAGGDHFLGRTSGKADRAARRRHDQPDRRQGGLRADLP